MSRPLPSQSTPTILVLKTWVGLWPWKKNQVQNMDLKKARWKKNRVVVVQKEKKPSCLFSFWITMTLFFAPCFFQVHILDLIFIKFQTLKKYQVDLINLNSGCRLTGRIGILKCYHMLVKLSRSYILWFSKLHHLISFIWLAFLWGVSNQNWCK